ncbi:hypothetical protein [Sulfurospirillum arcachonense]|uniref:hypothetical protein n=1 Tax=Sulfurospirillum arcachonense TaxID=57666 RepID=UPI000467FA26|nr:hypothetical protein [Sulfurospirillum arcachonense]
MPTLRQLSCLLSFMIVLSGCGQINIQEKPSVPPKKNTHYKYCTKHKQIMTFASKYIEKEFEKGYFLQKDIIGAKAQLFLIKNKSQTIFAKNINAAQDSYTLQYKLAKKYKCDVSKFTISPIEKINNTIKILEKNQKEKE